MTGRLRDRSAGLVESFRAMYPAQVMTAPLGRRRLDAWLATIANRNG